MPSSLADLWQARHTSTLTANWRAPDASLVIHDALLGKPHTLAVDDPWSRERYPLMQFIREAWHVIEPRPFVEGWHIEALCLPFQSKIITEDGMKAIGDIVESQWSGRVLTWSHDAMMPEWKSITAWMQSPSRPLIKIRLLNGGEISLTENHPVFVVGEGYVNAGDLSVGDACLRVRILRKDIQSSPKRSQSTLFKGMLSDRQGDNRTRKKFVDLPRVWKSLLSLPVSSLRRILQSRMFWQEQDSHRQKNMHTMWQGEKLWGWIFLQAMLGEVAIEGRVCAVSKLRQPCIPQPCTTQGIFSNIWSFLQSRMLRSFYERREQSGVYRWEISSRISRLIPAYAKAYFETRWYALLSLPIRWENGYSSYRQKQRQQRVVESCDTLSFLSQSSKRDTRRNCEVVECTISSIERDIRVPEALYNLEVADNHNYFADTVLVHNCMHLEAVVRRDIKRLLINIPMRSGKSVLQSVLFPAWVWITDPAHKFLCTSHSKDLALRDSVRCRQLVLSSWYRERWGSRFKLQGDVNVKSRYGNNKGGYRITCAVGGATGDGGDTLICDDLHSRNEDDSPSRADIRAAVDFFNGDFAGCLTDPRDSAIIVSGQRIAVDDISADILQKGGYCHLKIRQEYIPPAPDQTEPVTAIGWRDPRTTLGELMWPLRWGPEQVAEAKRRGLRKYQAHHQQDPEGSGGTLFWDEWWQTFTQWPLLETFRKIIQSWDMRFKDDREEGSYVVGQVWGLAPNGVNVFLLDEVRGRWDFNETKEAFVALCQKWPLARIKLVENKANGPAIYSALRRKTYGITLVDVEREGKFARGEKHTETAKAGQVWLPADTLVPWVTDWRDEAKHYPSEPNDRIDAATQAWDHLLPRILADDPRTEERKARARRQQLSKRVYQQQKITASRTGA